MKLDIFNYSFPDKCIPHQMNFTRQIYIKPGYNFNMMDHLITNFYLLKSLLLIMITAFYNQEKTLEAYDFEKK